MELRQPDLTAREVVLKPDIEVTRGRTIGSEDLIHRVSLGEPLPVALTADMTGDDRDLRSFIEEQSDRWRYWLVHLACTFLHDEDEPIRNAWLTVRFTRSRGDDGRSPIVWSMHPARLERPVENSLTLSIGATAKLVDARVETTRSTTYNEVFLESLGLQESEAAWEFTRTGANEIRGSHRLAAVVRTPADVGVEGSVRLGATILRKRMGLFTYTAVLPDGSALTFPLGEDPRRRQ